MKRKNPAVDGFLRKAKRWQAEMAKLRTILLGGPLTEELKWGKPCYTFDNRNVAIMQGFKQYCALLFPKGVLLKDPKSILIQQTENVQAARQLRFTTLREIVQLKSVIKFYIDEAIAVEKAGLEVTYKKTSEFKIPAELQNRLDEDLAFKRAFKALTPGRQRGYLLYFSGAKQSKTREARIEKCMPQIHRIRAPIRPIRRPNPKPYWNKGNPDHSRIPSSPRGSESGSSFFFKFVPQPTPAGL